MDWIDLAEDTDRWRDLVNAVRTFGFLNMWGISRLPENLLPSEEGIYFMDLVGWLVG